MTEMLNEALEYSRSIVSGSPKNSQSARSGPFQNSGNILLSLWTVGSNQIHKAQTVFYIHNHILCIKFVEKLYRFCYMAGKGMVPHANSCKYGIEADT